MFDNRNGQIEGFANNFLRKNLARITLRDDFSRFQKQNAVGILRR
jgi:hypothetical protein